MTAAAWACAAPPTSEHAATGSPLWGTLEAGPYAVGFTVVERWDRTRSFTGLSARPMQMAIWYPARPRSQPLRYREYVHRLTMPVDGFPSGEAAERATLEAAWGTGYTAAARERWLDSQVAAHLDARSLEGRFPVVYYAPGYGASVLFHVVTCEYLASHGYVVVSGPSLGDGPEGIAFDETGIDVQVRDIEFGLSVARERPDADQDRAGVVGFSFGGGSAVLTAMRDPRVAAVVSVDGVPGTRHAFAMMRGAAGYDAAALRVPFLHIGRPEPRWSDPALVRDWRLAPRWWLDVPGADHHDFVPGATAASAVGEPAAPHAALERYHLATTAIREFLDTHLAATGGRDEWPGRSARALGRILPWPAEASPPPAVALWAMLRSPQTADSGIAVYRQWARRVPGLPLMREGQFDRAGSSLLESDPGSAVDVMRLWAESYPASILALTNLGEAALAAGDTAAAKDAFRRAIELDADAIIARIGLDRIRQ